MKKVFSLLLALFLAIVLLPAKAEAATVASGTCGENLTWTLDGEGTLTISGTGKMYDYGNQNTHFSNYRSYIKHVVIRSGVTHIGARAFCVCALETISIPDTVSSVGEKAFWNCYELTEIDIPQAVTSIEAGTFADCHSLTRVSIPDSVTRIGDGAFSGCSALESITIPSGITEIADETFKYCPFTSIVIPQGVTSIGVCAFEWCTDLTEVSLPDSLTVISDYAFCSCEALPNITIPANVKTIGEGAFSYCESLATIQFQGDAPFLGLNVFRKNELTCYYPASNTTWTEDVMQSYGGTITWMPYNADFSSVKPTASVAKNSYNSLKVTWSEVLFADYYEVYRSTKASSGFVKLGTYDSETFSKVSSNLATGTKYYYKVRAYRVVDGYKKYSAYSDVVSGTPTLSAPTGVTVSKSSYNTLKVSWNKVAGASYYQVYRSVKGANDWKLLGVYDENTFSMTSRQLSTGTTYEYRVRCYRWANSERQFSGWSTVKSGTPTMSAPTGVKAATGTTKGTVTVSWNKVSGATYYQVYRSANGTSDWKLLGTYDEDTLSMTSKALGSGQTYYYRVRCYRWAGGERQFSSWSTIVNAVAK